MRWTATVVRESLVSVKAISPMELGPEERKAALRSALVVGRCAAPMSRASVGSGKSSGDDEPTHPRHTISEAPPGMAGLLFWRVPRFIFGLGRTGGFG